MFVNKRYTITVYQRAIQGYNNLILQNYKDWPLFNYHHIKVMSVEFQYTCQLLLSIKC